MHKLLSPTPTHTSCLGSLRVMTVINDGHGELFHAAQSAFLWECY